MPPCQAGWLGTLDLKEPIATHVKVKAGIPLASKTSKFPDSVGVLGSPWFPSNNCGQSMISPFGGSPPPLASLGLSPDFAAVSLASPSYIRDFHTTLGSPRSYLASNCAIQSVHFTPPQKTMVKSFGGPNAGPTWQQKISIDSISAPIMKDLKTSARSAPKSRH
ncbi:uncharacterized protein MELLADRAFT_90755 [Melampsora larici-populina 98AG31]|uniref:Uncharacterized protein n=1 Tax=Melampsora larici-populina (strain 98AG31 / pathotype 3-4-7) TaxID=747676 RepID=F4R7D1_MELLP|nr:uncharacterized protein MELLADRAFT_90755 [Melampsora larici-populina 98AG31]EGG11807.1 hypothetical protein MELLADRAFT_90755 [Melampsora larici-populina 98AG31]